MQEVVIKKSYKDKRIFNFGPSGLALISALLSTNALLLCGCY